MGELPDWYALLMAARYMHVPPWELLERSSCWREWALDAIAAENMAEKNLNSARGT